MVTNSPVWQQIADELDLRGKKARTARRPAGRIGLEMALEAEAVATRESGLDVAVKQETIAFIKKKMPSSEAEATIEKLQRGEITDDAARELASIAAEQQQDQKSRRVRQSK
jgi:hypothetical protein